MNGNHPRIGVGVIIVNPEGKVLIGRRIGSHAQKYSIPGGWIEAGESFEGAANREVKEETGMSSNSPQVIALTNNLETYKQEGKHTISVIVLVKNFSGEPIVMEPQKCEKWEWYDPQQLPEPHFDASKVGIECYLKKVFYKEDKHLF